MAITWTDVTDIAPELTSAPLGLQTKILADVNDTGTDDVWGALLDIGRAWLAAHKATLALRKGRAGQITQESAGSVSRGYAAFAGVAQLEATSYGIEYERLLNTRVGARLPYDAS